MDDRPRKKMKLHQEELAEFTADTTERNPAPKSTRVNWWQFIGWLVTVLALFFVGRWLLKLDHNVWRSLRHLNYAWLLGSIVVFQVWFLLRFLAWEFIVQRHGSESQRHITLRTWTLSELARYVPGNVWSFAAKYRGSVIGGAKPAATLQALGIEGFSQMTGAGLTAIALYDLKHLWWVALIIIFLFPVLVPSLIRILSKWKRWSEVPKISVVESLGLLLWYSAVWALFGLATAMTYWSFPNVPPVTLLWLTGVNVAAWFIGYITLITPMGLGVREVAFVKLTAGVVPTAMASLIALVTRLWFVVSELVFLLLVVLWSSVQRKRS